MADVEEIFRCFSCSFIKVKLSKCWLLVLMCHKMSSSKWEALFLSDLLHWGWHRGETHLPPTAWWPWGVRCHRSPTCWKRGLSVTNHSLSLSAWLLQTEESKWRHGVMKVVLVVDIAHLLNVFNNLVTEQNNVGRWDGFLPKLLGDVWHVEDRPQTARPPAEVLVATTVQGFPKGLARWCWFHRGAILVWLLHAAQCSATSHHPLWYESIVLWWQKNLRSCVEEETRENGVSWFWPQMSWVHQILDNLCVMECSRLRQNEEAKRTQSYTCNA